MQVPVPDVDQGPLYLNHSLCCVLSIDSDINLYQMVNKHGLLNVIISFGPITKSTVFLRKLVFQVIFRNIFEILLRFFTNCFFLNVHERSDIHESSRTFINIQ